MKNLRTNLIVAALCCFALTGSVLAQAHSKNKQKSVTLSEDLRVNDQLIKSGTYQFKFDATNRLVTIWLDGKSVTAATVTVTMGDKNALHNSLSTTDSPKGRVLTALTFAGDKRVLTFEEPSNAVAKEQTPND